jgi:hypothetical protein
MKVKNCVKKKTGRSYKFFIPSKKPKSTERQMGLKYVTSYPCANAEWWKVTVTINCGVIAACLEAQRTCFPKWFKNKKQPVHLVQDQRRVITLESGHKGWTIHRDTLRYRSWPRCNALSSGFPTTGIRSWRFLTNEPNSITFVCRDLPLHEPFRLE